MMQAMARDVDELRARNDRSLMFSACDRKEGARSRAFLGSLILQVLFVLALITLGSVTSPKLRVTTPRSTIAYVKPIVSPIVLAPHLHRAPTPAPVMSSRRIVSAPALVAPPVLVKIPEIHSVPPILPSQPPLAQPKPVFESKVEIPTPIHAVVKVQLGGFGVTGPATPALTNNQVKEVKGFALEPAIEEKKHGVVVSAEFGEGEVGTAKHGAGHVEMAGFGIQPLGSHSVHQATNDLPKSTPVSITAKAMPVYTDEARRLHIEGEVLVDVVFTANGNIHVIGVVKGLGHGLDEAALAAASRIHFVPSTRDGQPVDLRATLHIAFALTTS